MPIRSPPIIPPLLPQANSAQNPLLHLVILQQPVSAQILPQRMQLDVPHARAAVRHLVAAVAAEGVVVGAEVVGEEDAVELCVCDFLVRSVVGKRQNEGLVVCPFR